MAVSILGCIAIFLTVGCTDGSVSPTGTTETAGLLDEGMEAPSPASFGGDNPTSPTTSEESKEARGELFISGTYGQCVQRTNYDRDYMSVWRVHPDNGQSQYALYKNGEGNILCGVRVQVDCTVRESDPKAGHIKSGNLYDHFIGVVPCGEITHTPKPKPEPPIDPPCLECNPPDDPPECEDVWVIDEEAYDEEVCTPDEEVITGWTYKITGANDGSRRRRSCQTEVEYFSYSPTGVYATSTCIPGQGVVDGCVFDSDQGDEFDRSAFGIPGFFNNNFEFQCNETTLVEGECEIVHHEEIGHFEEVCE